MVLVLFFVVVAALLLLSLLLLLLLLLLVFLWCCLVLFAVSVCFVAIVGVVACCGKVLLVVFITAIDCKFLHLVCYCLYRIMYSHSVVSVCFVSACCMLALVDCAV